MKETGLFSNSRILLNFFGANNLGNLNLKSKPYSEIVVFPDFPIVPLELSSSFSPPLNIFLFKIDASNAIPMSSIFDCFKSNPNPREYFF